MYVLGCLYCLHINIIIATLNKAYKNTLNISLIELLALLGSLHYIDFFLLFLYFS